MEVLYVHLPNDKTIIFTEGEEEAAATIQPKLTQLEAYFNVCKIDLEARKYRYDQITQGYHFANQKWNKRKNDRGLRKLTRVGRVPPNLPELNAIRVLSLHRSGVTSFTDLKTVPNEIEPCETFVEAARRQGLFEGFLSTLFILI